ncbi:MAG: hypothetical protein ABIR38_04220 [Chthoniobacterales bacterium]
MRLAILLCSFLAAVSGLAQESPTPSPSPTPAPTSTPTPREVSLRFALPPLEGTISLGIYDPSGKLVRVLHREDTVDDFTTGHDALETPWDGNDDQGEPLPNGKYRARGYVVGHLKVEGVDYFFNDWVTDEKSPHLKQIDNVALDSAGHLILLVTLAGGAAEVMRCEPTNSALKNDPVLQAQGIDFNEFASPERLGVKIEEAKLSRLGSSDWQVAAWPKLIKPVAAALGKDGNVWVIDQATPDSVLTELREFSPSGEILRSMTFAAADPQPILVRASTTKDQIYLLEGSEALQRLRGLSLVATKTDEAEEPVSDWRIDFEKKIVAHQNFAIDAGKPVATSASPSTSPEKISQTLQADPLLNDKPGKIVLAVGMDEDGSFLRSADGLPLRTISETSHLTRALLSRPNDNTIDVFQDDGAVVEQFRVSNLAQMIAFDCGEFELK